MLAHVAPDDGGVLDGYTASMCSPGLAFLLQFGMFGSLSWFGCMSLDLYFSVTRPFTRPSSRLSGYQLWVWAGSMLTGAVAAMRHGDRPVYHVCWIARSSDLVGEPWLFSMGGLFFVWLVRPIPASPDPSDTRFTLWAPDPFLTSGPPTLASM